MGDHSDIAGEQHDLATHVRAAEDRERERHARELADADARGFAPALETEDERNRRLTGNRLERSGRAIEAMPQLVGLTGVAFFYLGFSVIDQHGTFKWTSWGVLDLLVGGVLVGSALLVRRRIWPAGAIALLLGAAAAIVAGLLLLPQPQGVTLLGFFVVALLLFNANAIRLVPERFHRGRYDR
jgi:hypothetical protein